MLTEFFFTQTVYEGLKQEHHYRQLDLEFVSWIMNLVDSTLVTDAAQTLRDLIAVAAVVPAPNPVPTPRVVESNGFVSSLDELAKIREECEHAHSHYPF